ncbi:MAG: 4-(cytidine 5'-diphospho)-2-C-methyl-D-erythritol kinase [Oscillospiraceae bacterium]|nr:4-(cytidine 5'-diphospho)-2-C-methyl-D-erythritol kinase [Oscillospiraceae bacterium]
MIALYASAYAKLNLYLNVVGKRDDGYHNIESVMQAVTLRDDMEIQLGTKQPWLIDSDQDDVPKNEENLCWKAAERFFAATGEDPDGLTVHILKRIPMGAGLAGGSTDAAALLRALDVHYGKPLSLDALCKLGSEIGSDVPFCVLGGTAIAEERGQILLPIIHEPQAFYVICKPETSLSTKEMFDLLDARGIPEAPGTRKLVNGMRNQNVSQIAANLYNVFETLAEERAPEIGKLRQQLCQYGALNARMTGSGTAVFGVFAEFEAAAAACEKLHKKYPETFLTTNGEID